MTVRAAVRLAALGAVLGFAVYRYGGVREQDWLPCLLALGMLGLSCWMFPPQGPRLPSMPRRFWVPLFALPCYLAFQLIPLPLAALRILSPARVELLQGSGPRWGGFLVAPLSVMPYATWSQLLRLAGYIIVFLLVREALFRLRANPWLVAWPLIAINCFEAILGILQYSPDEADPASGLAKGTYINRDHFAGLLEMALPFALMYAVVLFKKSQVFDAHKWRWRTGALVTAAGAVAIIFGIVQSLSRMGFVSALSGLLVVCAFLVRTERPAVGGRAAPVAYFSGIVILLVGLATVFSPSRLIDRLAASAGSQDLSSASRLTVWNDTLRLIRAYPIMGCGAGCYEHAMPRYKSPLPLVTVDFAHNDYLQGVAELGIVGGAIALFFLGCVFAASFRTAVTEDDPDVRSLAVACLGALTAIALHSFTDFNLYIPANGFELSWIAGIAAGLRHLANPVLPVISVGGYMVIDVKPVAVR